MSRERRRGMTLLEVMAALALSGAVIVAGAMLLDQAIDAVARISDDGSRQTRAGTGARLLRALLYDARMPRDSTEAFSGDERHVAFITRCPAPGGWLVVCRATLALDSTRDSTIVRVDMPGVSGLALRAFAGSASLRYVDPFVAARWTREWHAQLTMPRALAVVRLSDTIAFSVGGVHD